MAHRHADEPAKLLVDFIKRLPRGRCLDVAMGRGRNALFLAGAGFEVEGLDRDPEAVAACQEIARSRGLSLKAQVADLESYSLPAERYDLIVCFYYLQRDLIPQMCKALRPAGVIVYETFLIDQHLRTGHPRRQEYCFEHNELLDFFRPFRVLFYHEGEIEGGTWAARIIAQKPADSPRS